MTAPTPKITTISRDPFSRTELQRRVITDAYICPECGQRARFAYRVDPDDRPQNAGSGWSKHAFCSISCYRAYTG